MKEWTNAYNSFNSMKALCWRDRFEEIAEGKIPAPVSVSVDATNVCNLDCVFCQYHDYRFEKQNTVSEENLLWLADTIKELGAVSVCLAGGGEFLLHRSSGKFIRKLKKVGLEVGMITNGTRINNFMDEILDCLTWVGVSIDASNKATYEKIKGKDMFDKVITNVNELVNRRGKFPFVGYKFLIHPYNYDEVYDAASLALSMGVDDFHARPCYNPGMKWDPEMIDTALNQVKEAQESLETDFFHVYGITHKFGDDFMKNQLTNVR